MKKSPLRLFNQKGISLIEALVAFLIFSLVLLANGTLLSGMFKSKKESNIQSIIVDILQERLQSTSVDPDAISLCANILGNNISLGGKQYYVACTVLTKQENGVTVQWPVLAASGVSASNAQQCSSGNITDDCFVVGR